MVAEYNEVGEAIANAENIVIVGGGAVGVEFAGELIGPSKVQARNIFFSQARSRTNTRLRI